MPLTINSNPSVLSAHRQVNKAKSQVDKSLEHLSSGLRISRASDDAAGLSISEKLGAEIAAQGQAARNVSDGFSISNVADGALEQAGEITGRLTELAAQAANGTISATQRTALNNEYTALKSELDRISGTTEFNGQQLLAADSTITIQAGTDGSQSSQVDINLKAVNSASLGLATDLTSQANAQKALDEAKTAVSSVAQNRGEIGSSQNRLEISFNNLQTSRLNNQESRSRIVDADIASESANLVSSKILLSAALGVEAQASKLSASSVLKLLG